VLADTRPRILVGENPDFSAAIVDKALDGDASSTTGDDDADEHENQEYALLLCSTLHGGHPSTLHSPANPLRCFRRTYILWQALRFFGSIFLQSFCSAYTGLAFLGHPAFSLSISSCPCGILFLTAGNPRGFFSQGFSQMVSCELFSILLETRSPGRWTMCRVTLKKHVQHQQTPRTADTSANLEFGLSPARSPNVSTLSRVGSICN